LKAKNLSTFDYKLPIWTPTATQKELSAPIINLEY
jgi:hypothetical protein